MSDLVWFTADGQETTHEAAEAAFGLTPADAEARGWKFKKRDVEAEAAFDRAELMRVASLDGTEKPAKAVLSTASLETKETTEVPVVESKPAKRKPVKSPK